MVTRVRPCRDQADDLRAPEAAVRQERQDRAVAQPSTPLEQVLNRLPSRHRRQATFTTRPSQPVERVTRQPVVAHRPLPEAAERSQAHPDRVRLQAPGRELGAEYYDRRHTERLARRALQTLEQQGYRVTLERAA